MESTPKVATLLDLARALGISTGTVHRALHNHAGVSALTKTRVLQMAKSMQYRPNLAARNLARRRSLRISVNTLQGTTTFFDEMRAGIQSEADSFKASGTEIQFRTYPRFDKGEAEAFEDAVKSGVSGIITFASSPQPMRNLMRKAANAHIPIVCVATDVPNTGRLAVVSIDTTLSGSLAADLLGTVLQGRGKVAATVSNLAISEHEEKCEAFRETLKEYYPRIELVRIVEEHNIRSEVHEKSKALFAAHPDLNGIYVTTEASIPVLDAARDAGMLEKLAVVSTDLFPELISEIQAGHVLATIDQRPYTQGRLAFRVLHQFLVEGSCPSYQVTLSPHLVMRGSLEYFLKHQSLDSNIERGSNPFIDRADLEGYAVR